MSHLFQDYRFGSEIDSSDNRSNASLIAPNSDRSSVHNNAYYPPLTKAALENRNKLNVTTLKRPTSLVNSTHFSYESSQAGGSNRNSISDHRLPSTSIPLTAHTNQSWLDCLFAMSERVIDSRNSEPKDTRISVDLASSCMNASIIQHMIRFFRHSRELHPEEDGDVKHEVIQLEGWSLFLLSPTSSIRINLWRWIGSRWFEITMLVLLISQWILLSIEPKLIGSLKMTPTHILYCLIQSVFTMEMMAKIVVYGFCFNTRPSFRWISDYVYRQRGYEPVNPPELDEDMDQNSIPPIFHYRDRLTSFAADNAIRPSSTANGSITSDSLEDSVSALTASSSSTISAQTHVLQVHHHPYCASLVNMVDMMAIIAYWLQLILSATDTSWSPLSVFACCRLFRFLALTEGTQTLMISIYGSLDMLKNVMGFFVFFWVLFSLAALGLFPNAFTRQCAIVNETISWVEPRLACAGYWLDGERVGPLDWPSQTQLIYTGTDGYYCQLGQVCIQDTQNQPMHGHLSFQHMGYAMLNMFTIISTENWTDLLYIAQDSTSTWGTALFFASCIYVMTFILVPMFIAVITTSFSQGKQASPNGTQEKLQDWVDQDAPSLYRSEWQVLCYRISHHPYFQYAMNGLTLLSVIPMAWYPMDMVAGEWTIKGLLQRLMDSLFCIEIVIRAMGYLTLKQFWFDGRRNQFDAVIALATVLDSLPLFNRFHLILIIFPILRFYRILYLFPGVLQLTTDVIGDGKGIQNLVCFTFLVLFILASISVQLFGGDFEFAKDEPAMLFDTFYQAFLSLFQIVTGENWVDILYDAMHSQEYRSVTFAAVFISLMYFIVHYLVLNLFVAVIMQNFDLEDEEIKRIQIKKYIERKQLKPAYFHWDQFTRLLVPVSLYLEKKLLKITQLPLHLVARVNRHQFKQFYDVAADYGSLDAPSWYAEDFSTGRSSPPASIISSGSSVISHRRTSVASVQSTHQPFHEPMRYVDDYDEQITKENNAVIMENLQLLGSLMLFRQDSQIYHLCVQWTKSTLYKVIIIMLICLGSGLALWADEYHRVHDADQIAHVVEPIHRVLIVLYFGNVVVHGIANGLIILPDAYLRKLWNVLDVCNLIIQAILMVFGKDVASYLRVLRTLRVLRIMYHIQTMRHIFLDLLYGLPKLVDVVLLNLLVFLSFAVYGCALFSGQFVSCNEDGLVKQACTFEFASDDTMGILVPRVWENPYDYSFDTFGASFLHLFECASGEGWIRSLFTAMSVQRDQPLEFGWSMRAITHSMYYVVFMFIASLCSIQLFIGVFLEIFKQRNGISQLTSKQRQFQDLQRQLALLKPSRRVFRPQHPIRAFFYDLVINKRGRFARWMAHVIMINIVVFATEHLYQPFWLTQLQNILNGVCIGFYVFEIIAKILGLGFSKWKSIIWNVYDFVLVCLVLIAFVLKFYVGRNNLIEFTLTSCSKLFSVGIAFRLAQRNESLDTLFKSIRRAIPSIASVSCVFSLVMLCFAVFFQEIFGLTRYGPYGNDHANFRSLFNSILTLFRITTGEDWDALMHDFFISPFSCVNKNDCGSPFYAIVLFSTFYIMCTYIFVNLFTMIVIDNFSFTFDKRNRFTLITRSDLRNFKIAWSQEDPYATGYISVDQVPRFLSQLEGVLSIRVYDEKHSIANLMAASKQFDINPTHLTSISGSDQNKNKEQLFNFHQLNQQLTTMDSKTIRLRKRRYAEVYKEVVNTATRKGVEFRTMLKILAMQLIDASSSLRFDALIHHSRMKQQIEQQLAFENAHGLINMMVARRRFLKWRQGKPHVSSEPHTRNSIAIVGQWLQPSVPDPQRQENVPKIIIDSADPKSPSDESIASPFYSGSRSPSVYDQSPGNDTLRKINSMPSLLSPSSPTHHDIAYHCYVEDDKVQHMDIKTANDLMQHLNESVWSDMLVESG